MKASFLVLGCLVLVAGSLIECDSTPTCTGAACVDANNVPGVSGGGCDSSKPAAQGGCAVDDTDGFFVSPAGSDTAAGTKIAPFQTIGKGITAAAAAALKPNVYVCAGTFSENLVVQSAPAGVALHGGFECAGWTQVNANTIVAPKWIANATAPQYVLHVLGAAALVEGITLTAPDAMDPGASSVAVLVDGSPGMTFRRATVTAGKGMDGVTPQAVAQLAANSPGNSRSDGSSPPAIVCPCSTDSTTGGAGGGFIDGGFSNPTQGLPIIANDLDAGRAGTASSFATGGASGASAKDGNSTGSLGELTVNGWISSPGAVGATGGTAQGGGGAYGDPGAGVSGSGGGCGGCGGKGGAGGGGGGASIAVGAISSTVRFQNATIRAGKGGSGGNGTSGQPGQPGGPGGTSLAPPGGTGGTGGSGGAGGGGAGGVSIAIATANTTPDIDSQSTVLAGGAGVGGHDGSAAAVKAIDGIADPVHAF